MEGHWRYGKHGVSCDLGRSSMRYLIEYLHETTDEYSVCHTREIEAQEVVEAGHLARSKQFEFPEATGFQIRAGNRVVAIEDFCTDLESRTVH